jgi:hypothetical protein
MSPKNRSIENSVVFRLVLISDGIRREYFLFPVFLKHGQNTKTLFSKLTSRVRDRLSHRALQSQAVDRERRTHEYELLGFFAILRLCIGIFKLILKFATVEICILR